jgi:hypothetical protein
MIDTIWGTFNNREKALIVWLLILIVFFFSKSVFKSFGEVLKSLFSPKLFSVIIILVGYIILEVGLLKAIGFWDLTMLKDSIFWLFGSAAVFFFNVIKIRENENFFRDIIMDSIKTAALMEYVLNIYVFGFWGEFFLLPFLIIIVAMNTMAGLNKKTQSVQKLTKGILTITGLILIIYAAYNIGVDFYSFWNGQNLSGFLLSLFLTILFLPALYLLGLYSMLEKYFVGLNGIYRHNKSMAKYAKWEVIKRGKLNINKSRRIVKELHPALLDTRKEFDQAMTSLEL